MGQRSAYPLVPSCAVRSVAEAESADPARQKASGTAVRDALTRIRSVYDTAEFRNLLDELWSIDPGEPRHRFVRDVMVHSDELAARGIVLPQSVWIDRTYFEDNRPTLFAIVTALPSDLPFKLVTITVDDTESTKPID